MRGMTAADPVALSALVAAAAGTGVLHTLLGPDHYLPLLAIARERGFGARRALRWTAAAGLLHCLGSAVVVPVAIGLGAGAAAFAGVQEFRSGAAAWLLVGIGLVLMGAAWRRSRRPSVPRAGSALLLLAFALGPCEWLLPNALVATAEHGAGGGLLVGAVFTACTMATMLVCVAAGLRLVPAERAPRRGTAFLPGAVVAASGLLVLIGL
jgi:hypothetical protein